MYRDAWMLVRVPDTEWTPPRRRRSQQRQRWQRKVSGALIFAVRNRPNPPRSLVGPTRPTTVSATRPPSGSSRCACRSRATSGGRTTSTTAYGTARRATALAAPKVNVAHYVHFLLVGSFPSSIVGDLARWSLTNTRRSGCQTWRERGRGDSVRDGRQIRMDAPQAASRERPSSTHILAVTIDRGSDPHNSKGRGDGGRGRHENASAAPGREKGKRA